MSLHDSNLFRCDIKQIAVQAHAVVLTGGTLQPIEETRVRLFPDLSLDQVHFFSCNHIVPPESILPIVVSRGPSGMTFDFSYNSRGSARMVSRQLLSLVNILFVFGFGPLFMIDKYLFLKKCFIF